MITYNWQGIMGWLIFTSIFLVAWDSSIRRVMMLVEPLAAEASKQQPTPRILLFLLGMYGACRVTLLTCLYMLLLFCIMTCVQGVLPLLSRSTWFYRAASWLFDEAVLFNPAQPAFLSFHSAVFAGTTCIALTYACISSSKFDLTEPDAVRSAVVREALSMAAMSIASYLGILLYISAR